MLHVYDRRHQGHETEIIFPKRQQRADPTAVAVGKHAKLTAVTIAQCSQQLSQFEHALKQCFRVANEVRSNREFAIPITAWYTRKMIRQVRETDVPAEFVEAFCVTAMAGAARGHKCV